MAVKNQLASQQNEKKRTGFSNIINQPNFQRAILNTLQDKNTAKMFTASMVSAVTSTPALSECDPMSLISAGLLGEALKLSPSPQLGQYYLVPYRDNKNGRTVAQFQLGYKGYIQLATRSGQYRKLTVLPIKQGELISFNPLEEEIEADLIQDENERENAPTIGYYAMFEYVNGFRKAMYWSKEKMESHALKYSQGYRSDVSKHRQYTFWSKDFDGMACKTMLRQIISKWGIMSIELQKAYESDMGVISEDGKADFVDAPAENYDTDEPVVIETPPVQSQPEKIEPPPETLPEPPEIPANQNDFAMILEGFSNE